MGKIDMILTIALWIVIATCWAIVGPRCLNIPPDQEKSITSQYVKPESTNQDRTQREIIKIYPAYLK